MIKTFQASSLITQIVEWRRDFHQHPELLYDVHRTAQIVAQKLREFGCDEVVEGVGRTGVVGVINGKREGEGRVIGLRADMDALPIQEETNLPYRSKIEGKMHACGHDGHCAILLGAAAHLTATRDFSGRIIVIFQPAEEGGAGGRAMLEDGLIPRFGIEEVYALHNMPGLALGQMALCTGPIMAAADQFYITLEGIGSHAATPHVGVDPLLAGAHLVTALQSIASRNVDPLQAIVVSTTIFQAGTATNIIPQRVEIAGTVRSLTPHVRDLAEKRLREIAHGTAAVFGAEAKVNYERGYPPTINHAKQVQAIAEIGRQVLGDRAVNDHIPPMMGGGRFLLHAGGVPGRVFFHWQRGKCGLTSSRL